MAMTTAEITLLNNLGEAFNDFCALPPPHHPSDKAEFAQHIHALQNMIAARVAVRTTPEAFGRWAVTFKGESK